MKLLIFGPPGAGKGTVAHGLSQRLGIPHIDMGELLRFEIKHETDIGKEIKSIVAQGQLVPDETVWKVLRSRLASCGQGYILDGFPRTLRQAEMLEAEFPTDRALNLTVSDETVIRRLSARRTCDRCGMIYNLITMPPKVEGVCDRCGGRLIQREDDTPPVIRSRLEVYRRQTTPVLEYYERRGILLQVSGEGEVQEVLERVERLLAI